MNFGKKTKECLKRNVKAETFSLQREKSKRNENFLFHILSLPSVLSLSYKIKTSVLIKFGTNKSKKLITKLQSIKNYELTIKKLRIND